MVGMKYKHVRKMRLFRISQKAFGFTMPIDVMRKFNLRAGMEFDLEAELDDSGLLKITYYTTLPEAKKKAIERHEDNNSKSLIRRLLSIFKQSR